MNSLNKPVTVLIPVYKGLEITKACLQSVCDSIELNNFQLLIINDGSPEAEVAALCAEFAKRDNVELIENAANQGFVKSVNIGMKRSGNCDVVLLNSDTVVHGDWLSRLKEIAYKEEKIATVTPFSNNATICSFPGYGEWLAGYSREFSEQLDKTFAECNAGLWFELPTAVGFCMYIKRSAIELVGYFDEEAFGKGYGEECDFSLRLRGEGYLNAIAANAFVHHEGNVSFGETSSERKKQAELIIAERYPDYRSEVMAFIDQDPLSEVKNKVADKINAGSALSAGLTKALQEQITAKAKMLSKAQSDADSIANELLKANRQYQDVCGQLSHAQSLLQDAREAFSNVDNSLKEAQQSAENNARDMNVLTQERDILVEQKSEIQSEANRLREQLELIERSRAWRLIQWFKKLLGKQ